MTDWCTNYTSIVTTSFYLYTRAYINLVCYRCHICMAYIGNSLATHRWVKQPRHIPQENRFVHPCKVYVMLCPTRKANYIKGYNRLKCTSPDLQIHNNKTTFFSLHFPIRHQTFCKLDQNYVGHVQRPFIANSHKNKDCDKKYNISSKLSSGFDLQHQVKFTVSLLHFFPQLFLFLISFTIFFVVFRFQ